MGLYVEMPNVGIQTSAVFERIAPVLFLICYGIGVFLHLKRLKINDTDDQSVNSRNQRRRGDDLKSRLDKKIRERSDKVQPHGRLHRI